MDLKTSRRLIKFGNYSLCITLPKSLVRDLKLKKGDLISLEVNPDGKKITIDLDIKQKKEASDEVGDRKGNHKKIILKNPSRW